MIAHCVYHTSLCVCECARVCSHCRRITLYHSAYITLRIPVCVYHSVCTTLCVSPCESRGDSLSGTHDRSQREAWRISDSSENDCFPLQPCSWQANKVPEAKKAGKASELARSNLPRSLESGFGSSSLQLRFASWAAAAAPSPPLPCLIPAVSGGGNQTGAQ